MKKLLYIFGFILIFISCEDVIEVDLTEAEERLVVEANLLKIKGVSNENQFIRLTKTRGFFEEELTSVNNAEVIVTGDNGEIYEFVHDSSGFYTTTEFEANLMQKYYLNIEVDGEIYSAEETLLPVSSIDSITQRNDAGFGGDEVELKAYYTDPEGEPNYYLFTFFVNFVDFPTVEIYEDEFFDGNTIFALYQEEDLEPGDEVIVQNFGLSEQFYEYMNVLLSQVGSVGGPFQTQPAVVRGNIINETNPDNFPYGYFSVSESDQFIYTVKE